jgi:uncharacterized protein (DUF2336 family)
MLTLAHARALGANPSATVRADIAAAVGAELAAAALTAREAQIAEQILEALAHDVEKLVRQSLAEHVKECPFLPRDIAVTLARDLEDAVALPMLEHSPLLSDADLIGAIRTGLTLRQLAVARRKVVASAVAEALIETADPQVVGVVLANHGADIEESALLKAVAGFPGNAPIETLLVERASLPLTVCEVLITSVSATLRDRLVTKHHIPPHLADELVLHGRERSLTELLPRQGPEAAERLAVHLLAKGRLTPTLMLRALCLGDLGFFDAALAALAGIPLTSAKALIYDRGAGGLRGIYQSARLPAELFRAFRLGVNAVLDGHLQHGRAAFTQQIVDQLVLLYDDMCPTGLEHMLAQLSRRTLSRDPARVPKEAVA